MAAQKTRLTLHSQYTVGPVDKRLFGGFVEHLGRCIYGGIYDPQNPLSDKNGFRSDVIAALKELCFTVMRYPGGNFASGYHWQDGVGPQNDRPTLSEPAWQSIETNQFGTDEFMRFCDVIGCSPMLTANLGTGTPQEARQWLEYCNRPAGTLYADKRALNGRQDPYGVTLWCLGNEMDGQWQMGHMPAEHYAIKAHQTAKLMRDICPDVELVACGSSADIMPTYLDWDYSVLKEIDFLVDYISLHCYLDNRGDNTVDFLASPRRIDRQIESVDAVCRMVQAQKKASKRVLLCFDEWNVWYRQTSKAGEWRAAPALLEEIYTLEDALVVAGILNSFIRHADVVKIANLAQAVNVIAPILTGPDILVKQTIFYPFQMYAARRQGISLIPRIEGPDYKSPSYGTVAYIDASAILGDSSLHVFAVNRNPTDTMELEIVLCDKALKQRLNADILTGNDPKAVNSFEQPDTVKAVMLEDVDFKEGKARLNMPPLSLIAVTFEIE